MRQNTSSRNRFITGCSRGIGAIALVAALGMSTSAFGQCGGSMVAQPVPSGPFVVGQSLQLQATFGPQGSGATITAVVVNLECQNAGGCALACTDDGMVLQYNGDDTIASNTCGQALSTGLGNGDTFTNQITFTFANPINLSDGQTCSFRFGVTIASHSNDMTPNQITGTAQTQGTCSNGLPLAACGSYLISLVNPVIHIDKTVTPLTGCDGTQVTYSYSVTNTGDVPLSNVVVVDDNGTPGDTGDDFNPTFTGGDGNNNGLLDTNEKWTYTHPATPAVGTTTNVATVTGTYVSAQGNVNVMDDDDATVEIFPTPSCSIRTMKGSCSTTYCGDTDGCDPSYHWTGPGGFSSDEECITLGANNAAGTYCLTITDCNGCTSGGNGSDCCIMFTPPVAPSCTISVGDCPFPRLLTVNTQNCPSCTYQWGNGSAGSCAPIMGQTGNTFSAPAAGTYCVTITSANGCTSTCDVVVDECIVGGQGRTPGFWKQEQHFGHWPAPYCASNSCPCGPATLFCSVFNCANACQDAKNAYQGKTLLQVLQQGGGGFKALGRQAVSALLNSAHMQIDYMYTTQEVIDMTNAAMASCHPQPAQDLFSAQNELEGGPLGGQLYCSNAAAGSSSYTMDLNSDGHINLNDLNMLLNNWGNPGVGDVNHSGKVDSTDVAIMVYWIGQHM